MSHSLLTASQGIAAGAEPAAALTAKLSELSTKAEEEDTLDAATVKVPTVKVKAEASKARALASKRKRVSFDSSAPTPTPVPLPGPADPSDKENQCNGTRTAPSSSSAQPLTVTVQGEAYLQLQLLGKGGSSSVHRVMRIRDGGLFALKRIEIRGEAEDADADEVYASYANEISLLKALKGSSPHIIDLVAFEASPASRRLVLLLEAGDIDLAKLLAQRTKQQQQQQHSLGGATMSMSMGMGMDPLFCRLIWRDMLLAVDHIHGQRIVHGDLKPANFVLVAGHLKLIDFGIAKAIGCDTLHIYRDSTVGTVNYMSPEAICPSDSGAAQGMRLGRASDIWSLGCILYQMLYGRPPFASLSTVQKLAAIPNPAHEIAFPDPMPMPDPMPQAQAQTQGQGDAQAVAVVRACLQRDPAARAPIAGSGGLLDMPYLHPYRSSSTPEEVQPQQQQQQMGGCTSSVVQGVLAVLQAQAEAAHPSMRAAIQQWFAAQDPEEVQEEVQRQRRRRGGEVVRGGGVDCGVQTVSLSLSLGAHPTPPSPCTSEGVTTVTRPSAFGPAPPVPPPAPAPALVLMPADVRQEIVHRPVLQALSSAEAEQRARRWMRPSAPAEADDMRSALEKRMGAMRKFMDLDQDRHGGGGGGDGDTATETLDITGFR